VVCVFADVGCSDEVFKMFLSFVSSFFVNGAEFGLSVAKVGSYGL